MVPKGPKTLICPKCKAIVRSEGLILKEKLKREKIEIKRPLKDIPDTLPTTKIECPRCGNDIAYWWTLQTRAADEPETQFFRCTKCHYTWREYI